jgi:uncharacterized protein with von Willebrand factor type A (vWA) domain
VTLGPDVTADVRPTDPDEIFVRVIAAFGHLLHSAGVPVTPERSTRFGTSVALAHPETIEEVYWLGRVTLLTGHDQVEVYDRVFRQVFEGLVDFADFRGDSSAPAPPSSTPTGERSPGDPERSGERDFALCTEEELALIRRLIDQLPLVPPPRTGRRLRRHPSGSRLDVRSTLRRSHRTGGDPVDLIVRKRTQRPRRVVLIADVSGSMEPYARVYLHLMRGAVQALGAEAFVFATRLTRLTRALGLTHPDLAYRKALAAAPDWSGGTRIGRALAEFLDQFGRRGMARGAVVVIVSDGWEVDSPDLVGESMSRLSRMAHQVIWVNPRKAAEAYEPLVGGMAAALPYVDTFVSGHSLAALEDVMEAIRTATDRSPAGRRVAA